MVLIMYWTKSIKVHIMNRFDDIRPYADSEIPQAMHRIASDPMFPIMASYVFPDKTAEEVADMLRSITTIKDFQTKVMYVANNMICKNTVTELSCGGFENVDSKGSYIYMSNHRDIMLDASLLQNLLIDRGMDTTEITFGANLMRDQLIIDIGKSNKMFRVERPGGSIRDFFKASSHLSDYMRAAVSVLGHSLWIAQRNGRTKDGLDRTDQGVINMLRLSAPASISKAESLAEMHIVPVAISYEWEPCDVLKALEIYSRSLGPYVKKPGEDLRSVISGITGFKGRVHIQICKELSLEELCQYETLSSSSFNRMVAKLVDSRICGAYRLWPNNYIAHDMLYGNSTYAGHYSSSQKEEFIAHMNQLDQFDDCCPSERLRDIFLGIYAGPVDSQELLAKE